MSSRKRRRDDVSRLCGRLGSDDGIDPRTFFDNRSQRRDLRKARQLCKQVGRTLDLVLGGEVDDDRLRNLHVDSVDPFPDSSRLLVVLRPFAGDEPVDAVTVLERLHTLTGRLRSAVAESIHRRKVPELVFRVAGDRDASNPEGSR